MTILSAEIIVREGEIDFPRKVANEILSQAMAHPTAMDNWQSLAAAGTVDYMLGYVDLKLTPHEHQDFIDQAKVIIEQAIVVDSNMERLRESLQRWHSENNARMFDTNDVEVLMPGGAVGVGYFYGLPSEMIQDEQ